MKHTSSFFFILSFVFIISFSSPSARAQDYYGNSYAYKPISLGLTFSPNMSWMHFGNDANVQKESEFSFGYGLLADFAFAENYYFATGLLVNTMKAAVERGPDRISTSYKLQYAEIPIGLKLKSTQRYYRSYYGQFGFTGGLKLNGEYAENDGAYQDLGSDAKNIRLALNIGGGVEWQLDHNLRFVTGLSFNNGFTKVLDRDLMGPKNSYLAVNLALFF
jgi:hypothetical protein